MRNVKLNGAPLGEEVSRGKLADRRYHYITGIPGVQFQPEVSETEQVIELDFVGVRLSHVELMSVKRCEEGKGAYQTLLS